MIPCHVCGSTDSTPFLRGRDHASGDWFELQRCRACGLVFIDPLPSDLGRYYHPTYRRYPPWAHNLIQSMYRLQANRWARERGHSGCALEIGCGEGWMLAALRRKGWQVLGTERTAASARFAVQENHLHMVVGNLDALQPTPRFDLIFMHHVLEHMPDPLVTLRACSRLLKPDGVLLIIVPNLASWQFRWTRQHWFHLDVPRHVTHFTPATLSQALEKAGFRAQHIRYVSLDQDPFGWMVSLLNLLGFPQTRWLHWLTGAHREPSLTNLLMLLLSPLLLVIAFILAPLSWLAHAGACMEVRAVRSD